MTTRTRISKTAPPLTPSPKQPPVKKARAKSPIRKGGHIERFLAVHPDKHDALLKCPELLDHLEDIGDLIVKLDPKDREGFRDALTALHAKMKVPATPPKTEDEINIDATLDLIEKHLDQIIPGYRPLPVVNNDLAARIAEHAVKNRLSRQVEVGHLTDAEATSYIRRVMAKYRVKAFIDTAAPITLVGAASCYSRNFVQGFQESGIFGVAIFHPKQESVQALEAWGAEEKPKPRMVRIIDGIKVQAEARIPAARMLHQWSYDSRIDMLFVTLI